MRKYYAEDVRGIDETGPFYLATEVDAHLAALQAQHAEALAEKDKRIARLEEKESAEAEVQVRYAQFKAGQKLHLVYEPGEGHRDLIVRAGFLSGPLCGKKGGAYRMTINVPLGNACKGCLRINRARDQGMAQL